MLSAKNVFFSDSFIFVIYIVHCLEAYFIQTPCISTMQAMSRIPTTFVR